MGTVPSGKRNSAVGARSTPPRIGGVAPAPRNHEFLPRAKSSVSGSPRVHHNAGKFPAKLPDAPKLKTPGPIVKLLTATTDGLGENDPSRTRRNQAPQRRSLVSVLFTRYSAFSGQIAPSVP